MKNTIAGAVVVFAIVVAGGLYLRKDSTPANSAPALSAAAAPAHAAAVGSTTPADGAPRAPLTQVARPLPSDPRLAALAVSPDNGLIQFVVGKDGKVISEIDQDPNSLGFKKPLREYTYSGERVTGLTAYKYLGDQVQVTRTAVSYKPDGSVDQYRESTNYDFGKKPKREG